MSPLATVQTIRVEAPEISKKQTMEAEFWMSGFLLRRYNMVEVLFEFVQEEGEKVVEHNF